MSMTEEEARTKWCPMIHSMPRILFSESIDEDTYQKTIKAREGEQRKYLCIASGCMAWRWNGKHNFDYIGYCGLGGEMAR